MAVNAHGEQLGEPMADTGSFDLWIKLFFLRLMGEVPGLEEGEKTKDEERSKDNTKGWGRGGGGGGGGEGEGEEEEEEEEEGGREGGWSYSVKL